MKTHINILVQMVFLLLLSQLSFSQEVEVNLGGISTSYALVVKDSSGNVLLKMDGDQNFGINSEQPDGILIKGRNTLENIDAGDPITIVGGSTPVTGGGSITVFGGGSVDYAAGGSINIASGYGLYDGGDVNITTGGGAFDIGDINISTSSNGNNAGGSITLSTGRANSGGNNITLNSSTDIGLAGLKITLKTQSIEGYYAAGIRLETGYSDNGDNNIELIVGNCDGTEECPRGILLNPSVGLVEIIGSGTYTGTWTQASDKRYKSNIKPLLGLGNKVNLLQPVEYEWNKEQFPEHNFPDGNQIGLIAQEVEKLFPEIVATNTDGYKSVDYSKISVLLIQAIKEQQNEIEKQADEMEKQSDKIEKQSDEINKMKSELEELKSMIMQDSNKFSSNDILFMED